MVEGGEREWLPHLERAVVLWVEGGESGGLPIGSVPAKSLKEHEN